MPEKYAAYYSQFADLGLQLGDSVYVDGCGERDPISKLCCALIEYLGTGGTVLALAQSVSWRVRGSIEAEIKQAILVETVAQPTTNIEIANVIGQTAGCFQSAHPVYPFVSIGREAEFLTSRSLHDFPFGEGSPIARLHQIDGKALFIGPEDRENPLLRLAEHWCNMPYAERSTPFDDGDGNTLSIKGVGGCTRGLHRISPIFRQARIDKRGTISEIEVHTLRAQWAGSLTIEILKGDPEALLCLVTSCSLCTEARGMVTKVVKLTKMDRAI